MQKQKFWTDYPMEALGDEPYTKAPVREIEVLSYDNNKYCYILVKGTKHIESIKAGYIYTEEGRCGKVPSVTSKALEKLYLPSGLEFTLYDWITPLLKRIDKVFVFEEGTHNIKAVSFGGEQIAHWNAEYEYGWYND